jgi:hypothetical protein
LFLRTQAYIIDSEYGGINGREGVQQQSSVCTHCIEIPGKPFNVNNSEILYARRNMGEEDKGKFI